MVPSKLKTTTSFNVATEINKYYYKNYYCSYAHHSRPGKTSWRVHNLYIPPLINFYKWILSYKNSFYALSLIFINQQTNSSILFKLCFEANKNDSFVLLKMDYFMGVLHSGFFQRRESGWFLWWRIMVRKLR